MWAVSAWDSEASAPPSNFRTFARCERKPTFMNAARTSSLSNDGHSTCSTSSGKSRSVTMVAISRERNAESLLSRTFSNCLPFRSSRCSYRPSKLPYFDRNFAAVLSPTPGTPGILSAESPFSPRKSGNWSGVTP